MNFVVRPVSIDDLEDIYQLTKQFTLLNLPSDKQVLSKMIKKSEKSFNNELPKEECTYIFGVEDLEKQKVISTSLIIAKHGTEDVPHYSFKLEERDHFSKDIGVGFVHQVLVFNEDMDGPTEIGGLLLDKDYRSRPEKLGRLISLSRFLYMRMHGSKFEDRVLCELSPPLGPDGRSEFWEALGRRFTGLPYVEADQISQTNKEFISTLFPKEPIYLCLFDSKARLDIGRVGEATIPAKHMLEKIGFKYINEVDPFDGAPHYSAMLNEIEIIKKTKKTILLCQDYGGYETKALLAADTKNGFRSSIVNFRQERDGVAVPKWQKEKLGIEEGQEVYIYELF